MSFRYPVFPSLAFGCVLIVGAPSSHAQNAQLTGVVTDVQKAVVARAKVEIVNQATATRVTVETNGSGGFTVASLIPGLYQVSVSAPGFQTEVVDAVSVSVSGKLSLDVTLRPGNVNETVSVNGSGIQVNTTDASVSSVIDRQFVENIPLNGRSFQSLLTLVPGVTQVPVPTNGGAGFSGEITVNGQRTESNYFTVDGVSANTGAAAVSSVIGYGAGYSGSTPQETVLGTTQSIVPIEALQEFRATTSTYSAQYGRTPGGQFEFLTRSGTNGFHGNAFEYLRNDAFDANSAFNDFNRIAKPRERQNDFGGTLGGPIFRDRTFFFGSYEGLRLRAPLSAVTDVPTYEVRAAAVPAMRPFLNAFSLPTPNLSGANGANGETNEGNGMAIFQASYSAPSSIDNGTLRVDQQFGQRLHLFGRYGYTRSEATNRNATALSELMEQASIARTVTVGATATLSSRLVNDLRFNYTASTASSQDTLDNFGGAVPFSTANTPVLSMPNSNLYFELYYGKIPYFTLTPRTTAQHQMNVVDWVGLTLGKHSLRFGVDYRHLANSESYPSVYEFPVFISPQTTAAGLPYYNYIFKLGLDRLEPTFNNTGLYAQDEWKATDHLSVSLGLRWDLYPPPSANNGALPYALTTSSLATATLAPQGTGLWHTRFTNFSPRLGLAYQTQTRPGYETTLRAGFGMFYDLPYATALQDYWGTGYMAYRTFSLKPFPASQALYDSSPTPSSAAPYNSITYGFNPNLRTPYTLQYNAAVEQGLGSKQTLLVNYVASGGRLLLADLIYDPTVAGNKNFVPGNGLYLNDNVASSSYNALQVRFDRKLSAGLQSLLSYTWSHSIDNVSSDFASYQLFTGPSDFDVRHNFQAALTYEVPGSFHNVVARQLLAHWAADSRVSVRSALPVNVLAATSLGSSGQAVYIYPNRIPNQPLYLYGPQYAGGRAINYNAFQVLGSAATGYQQGNFGRNSARGFDAVQADIALRKDFVLHEGVGLLFRAEAFNVLNHPIWGGIYNQLSTGAANFGKVSSNLNSQLGGLNPLYQTGGPRSLQLALKLHF